MATATHVGPILVSGLGIQGPATTQTALPSTLLLVNNAGTGYITGCGPSPGVNGEIIFQTDTSNGANPQRVLALEGDGDGIFYADLSIAAGQLRLGLRSRGGWDSGTTNINSDGASLYLNATTAAGGSIFLNLDQGTGGVRFGDGFGNQVGHIDESGNLTLSGTAEMLGQLNAFGGISTEVIYVGQTPLASGAKLVYIGTNPTANTTEIQAASWDATNPIFDQTLQLNPLGGDVEIGEGATIDYAGRGDFTGLFVLGSQVLTAADLPPDAIPYPPAGVPVSTGTAWSPSINPATLARYPASGVAVSTGTAWGTPINPADLPRLSTPNAFAANQTINGALAVTNVLEISNNPALGAPSIVGDGTSISLNAKSGGWTQLNWSSGNGVQFGNGQQVSVGSVDTAGNAQFAGTATANIGKFGTSIAIGAARGTDQQFILAPQDDQTVNFTAINSVGSKAGGYQFFGYSSDFSRAVKYLNIYDDGTSWNTFVTGNFTVAAGTKAFVVPHPLDEKKDLYHACLEGPENGVYYRGEAKVKDGKAEVKLPDYFEALTFEDDRSVQLTQVYGGKPMYARLAASRVVKGKFTIYSPDDAIVAWEVKAVRRVGVDRLAVVRNRLEAAHESERSREEGSRTRSRTSSTHRA